MMLPRNSTLGLLFCLESRIYLFDFYLILIEMLLLSARLPPRENYCKLVVHQSLFEGHRAACSCANFRKFIIFAVETFCCALHKKLPKSCKLCVKLHWPL
jgi:hypothetical protein